LLGSIALAQQYDSNVSIAGKWTRQTWSNIAGPKILNLTSAAAFYQASTVTAFSDSSFVNLGDNSGTRSSGFITPTTTGYYRFWLSGDDEAQLFLSTDSARKNRQSVIGLGYPTLDKGWDKYLNQRSEKILLNANTKYYIEVLHKNAVANDHAAVSWALENGIRNWTFDEQGRDWAQQIGVTVNQSTTTSGFPASLAIDSDPNTYSYTSGVAGDWWQLDLGQDRIIDAVELKNRLDAGKNRLSNFRVSILNASNAVVMSQDFYPITGYVGFKEIWQLTQSVTGRKIKVQILGLNRAGDMILNLSEVAVWGRANAVVGDATIVRPSAIQASDYASGTAPASGTTADKAIDNNIGTINHTLNTVNNWWLVDLGTTRLIDTVEIVNRNSNSSTQVRLSNYRLSLLDPAGVVVTSKDFYPVSGFTEAVERWELPTSVTGRFLRIDSLGLNRMGDYYFHFAEVRVLGRENAALTNRGLRQNIPAAVMSSYAPGLSDDKDNDGMLDSWETLYGFNPLVFETGNKAGNADPDGDLQNNASESYAGANPNIAASLVGFLSREEWYDMPYYVLGKTRKNPRYFEAPQRQTLQQGSASGFLPDEYSAGRVRGSITPTVTGNYRFWISSWTAGELWLSTTGDKYRKRRLCGLSSELGTMNGIGIEEQNLWDWYPSQMSQDVYLTAGTAYYLEADYQFGHRSSGQISLAWAQSGGVREAIPASILKSYIKTTDDLDDDYLPDAWETLYGLNPNDNGRLDLAKQGEWGDFDSDGINNREEYVLGANPANADTDGDGLKDGEERSTGSDPLVAQTGNVVVNTVNIGTVAASSTGNTMTSGGLISDNFRGSVEWDFTVPSSGLWMLRLRAELLGSVFGNESVPLNFWIDGKKVGRKIVNFGDGRGGMAQIITPSLTVGTHRLKVLVDNMIARRSVKIVSLEVLQSTNAATLLATENFLITPSGVSSRTSPLCLEGKSRDLVSTSVNSQSVNLGTGLGHWYANVPLANNANLQSFAVAYETGSASTATAYWQATNVLNAETLTIRKGDSLRVGAWIAGNSTSTATLNSSAGGSFNVTADSTVAIPFANAGTFTVTATVSTGQSATLTVIVRDAPVNWSTILDMLEGIASPKLYHNSSTDGLAFDCGNAASLQLDVGNNGVAMRVANQPNVYEFGVAARLGVGGPIMMVKPVNVIGLSDALQNDLTAASAGPISGYKLITSPLTVTNLPVGGSVVVTIFRAGMIFPNGSTTRTITNADLNNGSTILEFLYPLGTSGGYCHANSVYGRNGEFLGDR
jgi:F5/8 type C domain/Bacterial TSP3 repeat/PA14 domain